MPTYTYRCSVCDHTFELFHRITEHSPRPCPVCGNEAYRQIGNGAGLIFKGSGFYATDYKHDTNGGSKVTPHHSSKSLDSDKTSDSAISEDSKPVKSS